MSIYNANKNSFKVNVGTPLIDAHACANAVEGGTPGNGPSFSPVKGERGAAPIVQNSIVACAVLWLLHVPLAAAELEPVNLKDEAVSISASLNGLQLAAIDRRIPGQRREAEQKAPSRQPKVAESHGIPLPPGEMPRTALPVPDRWRLVNDLGLMEERWYDPYNQNTLKADKPVHGDWFFNLSLISDTVFESRRLPTPVGPQSTTRPGSADIFGLGEQTLFNENLALGLVYYKGDTTFRPPDIELRLTPVFNFNRTQADEARLLNVDPATDPRTRKDDHVGIQELFADFHLRNVSERYDFDSLRIGIQPFTSDFRGFLFNDLPAGIRLFGTRDNNIFQYNLGLFRRLEKDTNSGLNDVEADLREDDILAVNLYWQDLFVKGYISQFSLLHNRNRESADLFYDNNGFIARPASLGTERLREYDVTYLGYAGDGHWGRLNLSLQAYYAFGEENLPVFVDTKSDIDAGMFAAELSLDSDWKRWRLSFLYASGDEDPFDDKSTGFDAVAENPLFAGADTSFWIRQGVPNIGGGGVALSTRNGILNNLRSSKEHGQSNFTNPGTVLFGFGGDFDLTPQSRLSFNLNRLSFAETAVLEVARNQGPIDEEIGLDASIAWIWRPLMSQNIIVRASYATLLPGDGYKQLFENEKPYSALANIVLAY
jgi:hypothetical protein